MKKLMVLFSAVLLTMMSMSADTYNYLNFVNANSQITQFSTTGLRMTFNGGKATVTAGGQTQTINLSSMAYMEFTNTASSGTTYPVGDVNGDGSVDVADVNILINIMLGLDDGSAYDGRQYVTGNSMVDVADVNYVINAMLGKV
ncbi:MAG: dockerin type I repeat-containing protein [Muribaculaceae bacterium]|nr:dockerin type I repeat-containing protein [Muribaculaceae bacterium]